MLKSDKINQALIDLFDMLSIINTDETISQQNFRVLLNIINENVSISFEIQIHQNMNSELIDQVIARYSTVWSETEQVVNISEKY